jgi:hypothetical protein
MPEFNEHKEQAYHNRKLSLKLDKASSRDPFHDWTVTTAFYASLHLVEAMTAMSPPLRVPSAPYPRFQKKKKPVMLPGIKHSYQAAKLFGTGGHELRTRLIRANLDFYQSVGDTYLLLRNASQDARYECQQTKEQDAKTALHLMRGAFQKFEAWEQKQARNV